MSGALVLVLVVVAALLLRSLYDSIEEAAKRREQAIPPRETLDYLPHATEACAGLWRLDIRPGTLVCERCGVAYPDTEDKYWRAAAENDVARALARLHTRHGGTS